MLEGIRESIGGLWEMFGILLFFDFFCYDISDIVYWVFELGVLVKMIIGD